MESPWKVYTSLYLLLISIGFVSIVGKKTPSSRRAAFHFDESLINIWLLPKQFTSGNRTVTVDPDLALDLQGSGRVSTIIAEAFDRFRNVVFKQQSGYAGVEFDISKKSGPVRCGRRRTREPQGEKIRK
ncbi:hypothetical protein KSP40_PGU017565 [Platanthera guangdongensis]|uniref:Uncharacterized protein n=1 Tax=Platanthera guangdongensis TaxID=2320717 RepID=A0ABR2MPA8_9ASPA